MQDFFHQQWGFKGYISLPRFLLVDPNDFFLRFDAKRTHVKVSLKDRSNLVIKFACGLVDD